MQGGLLLAGLLVLGILLLLFTDWLSVNADFDGEDKR